MEPGELKFLDTTNPLGFSLCFIGQDVSDPQPSLGETREMPKHVNM